VNSILKQRTVHTTFNPVDNGRLNNLCGPYDTHLHQLEKYFDVKITHRSGNFHIQGNSGKIYEAQKALQALYEETLFDRNLSNKKIHYHLLQPEKNTVEEELSTDQAFQIHHKIIQAKTANQRAYMENLIKYTINFAIGPAGTGKTYLAVACAVSALAQGRVKKLIFVRPAVEAGEKLGFLPGDLVEKVLPYLRPMYDALYDILGFEETQKLIGRNVIEIAPLAFMRGRTLNDAFIILDEAQNTTPTQMKMFLTRIGFGSAAIITGDITQIDLPRGSASGLTHAVNIIKDIPGICFNTFSTQDIVRNPIISKILTAYENDEKHN
jgi:phosphate starvation-inducible PhoH-like protein